MIPAFERAKTVHALDRAATVIGYTEMGIRNKIEEKKVNGMTWKNMVDPDIGKHQEKRKWLARNQKDRLREETRHCRRLIHWSEWNKNDTRKRRKLLVICVTVPLSFWSVFSFGRWRFKLASWSWILLEKLTITWLLMKLPTTYGTPSSNFLPHKHDCTTQQINICLW